MMSVHEFSKLNQICNNRFATDKIEYFFLFIHFNIPLKY